jgi:hypothetical protein
MFLFPSIETISLSLISELWSLKAKDGSISLTLLAFA